MTASLIFDAPLGSLVSYSDNQPKPPARFGKKLASWKSRNGVGRLVRKEPARERPTYTSPPCFTLHEGDFGKNGIVLVTVMRSYGIDSDLTFKVIERPEVEQVRVVQNVGDNVGLLHLADSREAAELWLAKEGHSRSTLDEVTADETSADDAGWDSYTLLLLISRWLEEKHLSQGLIEHLSALATDEE